MHPDDVTPPLLPPLEVRTAELRVGDTVAIHGDPHYVVTAADPADDTMYGDGYRLAFDHTVHHGLSHARESQADTIWMVHDRTPEQEEHTPDGP